MNDLMTKSFQSYVELKKQVTKDLESGQDIEMGKLDPADERNLSQFFDDVAAVKSCMEEFTSLLLNLQDLNEETKSCSNSAKVLRGLRDRINSDMVSVLRKAKLIKMKLESLDRSNVDNRGVSAAYKEGSPVDRMRISVTSGLRVKLRDMMNGFQSLRETIVNEHRDGLKKMYYNATGEEPSEDVIEKMISGGNLDWVSEGKADLVIETQERHKALKDIQRSLIELHKVFLDMAVLVDTQSEHIDDIEQNVAKAGNCIRNGTKDLDHAKKFKISNWARWIGLVVLVLLFVCLVSIWVW